MTPASISDLVLDTIRSTLRVDLAKVSLEASILDLGLDSLQVSVLTMELEDLLKMEFDDDTVKQVIFAETVDDIVRAVGEASARR